MATKPPSELFVCEYEGRWYVLMKRQDSELYYTFRVSDGAISNPHYEFKGVKMTPIIDLTKVLQKLKEVKDV